MFTPYQHGTESMMIDDLTLENGLDVINVYGNLQLYADEHGLAQAKQLQQLFTACVQHLEALQQQGKLPEKTQFIPKERVNNPFL